MNLRRLLLLAGAIAAVFVGRKIQKDVARYDRLARMSGDKTLLEDQFDRFKTMAGAGRRGSG